MDTPGRPQDRAPVVVYATGSLIVLLIAAAAAWVSVRDRDLALRSARQYLDNFTLVLAEHTAVVLRAEPQMTSAFRTSPPGRGTIAGEAFQQRIGAAYAMLELAYGARVLLFTEDGTLVAAFPRPAAGLGRSFAAHRVFAVELSRAPSGVVEGLGLFDASERLLAYRKLAEHPLVVVVSSPREDVLASWRRQAAITAVAALAFMLLAGVGTLLLARQLRLTGALTRELAEREVRLGSIIGSAMDAIVTIDEKQHIVLFNAAAERIFGCSAREAIGSPLEWFIPERYRAVHREHVERFGRAGATMRRMGGELVLSGRRLNGEEFPIDASISHATVGGRRFYTVILRDVTERQRAQEEQRRGEQRLRESEARLNSIISSAMDAVITVDDEQNVVLFNKAAEKIFGCSSSDALDSPLERFIPERYRAAHHRHVERFGADGVTMRCMGGELVLTGLRADGEEFPIDASISSVTVSGRKFYTVILRDITERHRAAEALGRSHTELRELYERMHEVREAERTRIARELHDELAQWLTALKMDVSLIASRLPAVDEQLAAKAQRMKGVVDNTVAAVRRIAADLRPVMLDDLGLAPALESLLNALAERTGITVSLTGDVEALELQEPAATAVYRMVQEALTNTARHSGASEVQVHVEARDGKLEVAVRDNGRGFKPDPHHKSYGVLGIRERARTLGGEAVIFSPRSGGTVVHIEVPLPTVARTGSTA